MFEVTRCQVLCPTKLTMAEREEVKSGAGYRVVSGKFGDCSSRLGGNECQV